MGALEFFQQPGWQAHIGAAFKDSGWNLYAVLGIATLVLIVMIVRLFPKTEASEMKDINVKEGIRKAAI